MRYSYEFKRHAVDLYRQGKWPDIPEGIKNTKGFHDEVRRWVRLEELNGPEVLRHKSHSKEWSPDEKLEIISKVLAGHSYESVAIENGINNGLLYQWVRKYKMFGYNGLVAKKRGRRPKDPDMKKLNYNNPRRPDESEYEELIRLRAENAYIKSEIEVIKKEIALREEKEAARLKAKKQRSLRSSVKKDTD